MKVRVTLAILLCSGSLLSSCNRDHCKDPQPHQQPVPTESPLTGVIQLQGISSYQYGSHVLTDNAGNATYALRSSTVNLNNYVGRPVMVNGSRVQGYPVDGGPIYIEVTSVR